MAKFMQLAPVSVCRDCPYILIARSRIHSVQEMSGFYWKPLTPDIFIEGKKYSFQASVENLWKETAKG